MLKLSQIVRQAVFFASRQPRWWLLALFQSAAFSVIGQFARPKLLGSPYAVFLVLAGIILSPITIWLWREIEADKNPSPEAKRKPYFFVQSFEGGVVVLATAAIIILARLVFPFWPLHTLVFALAASTAGLALLYIALTGHTLAPAFKLALDTWNKKLSLVAMATLVLILAHAISFILVHEVWGNVHIFREFSVLGHSATIWILLTGLTLAIAYFSAILNCFVVLLFLEIINRKKDPEAEKTKLAEPVRVGAT